MIVLEDFFILVIEFAVTAMVVFAVVPRHSLCWYQKLLYLEELLFLLETEYVLDTRVVFARVSRDSLAWY